MPRSIHHLVTVLVGVALLVSACGDNATYTPLTADDPVAEIAEGLSLSVNPALLTADFGVHLSTVPAQTFTSGQAGSQWQTALAGLPANLRLVSPLYSVKTKGSAPSQLFLAVIAPAGVNTSTADLYAWDGQSWYFLPATVRGNQLVANVTQAPQALGVFEAAAVPPLALTTLEPGQILTPAAAAAVNGLLLGGVIVQADGSLAGQLPATPDQTVALYPLVRNYDPAAGAPLAMGALLTDAARRANHLQQLTAFAGSGNYAGLALDYRGLGADLTAQFSSFVAELASRLHTADRALLVLLPTPAAAGNGYATDGYHWPALGSAADAVLLSPANDPAAYGNGSAESVVIWAITQVNRSRLRLVTSSLPVDGANGSFVLLDPAAALAPLGSVQLNPELKDPAYLGQTITATLSGQLTALDYDAAAFAARYAYDDNGTAHTVWLTTADTIRQRLALAGKYHLGGAVVTDLATTGVAENVATAINEYKVNMSAAAAALQPNLVWTVSGASGVVAQATAQPGQPFIYTAQDPGDYTIAAELQAGGNMNISSAPLTVANVTPTPVPVVQGGGTSGGTSGGGSSGGGSGTFVPPPPAAAGNFELGGQVPGYIGNAGLMQQAGMKWVKFQAVGDTSGMVAAGHGAGFKVLLSAVGDRSRGADPSYWPEYAQWVAGMAAQGADAIEVWNEANLDREWPNGQISGTTYTELLRQAYAAIKAANPNTMVISGAPAPTGAAGNAGCIAALCNDDVFLSQMATAGAANYMDCVGVHFNTGTTSPNVDTGANLSGYHYSYYYWPMVNLYSDSFGGSRPLCFTELGYLTSEGYGPLSGIFTWASVNTLAQQAQWLAESASLSANSGKVRLMIVWNVDFTVYGADPQAGYAILRPDGSCPACSALDAVMP